MEQTQDGMIHAFFHWAPLMFRDRGEMFSSAPDAIGKCEHTSTTMCLHSAWFCPVFLISIISSSLLCSSVHLLSPSFLVWVTVVFHNASNLPNSQSWSYNDFKHDQVRQIISRLKQAKSRLFKFLQIGIIWYVFFLDSKIYVPHTSLVQNMTLGSVHERLLGIYNARIMYCWWTISWKHLKCFCCNID